MAHQDLAFELIESPVILEIPVAPTAVVDTRGDQTHDLVNRLFLCTGTIKLDFQAPGYTPDDGTLVFPILDDDGSQLALDPGDRLIRAGVHVSLNEIKNDGGESFQFGVVSAAVASNPNGSGRPPTTGPAKLFIEVNLDVAGGDDDNNGHVFRISYTVSLLARIGRPAVVKLPFVPL